MTTDGQESVSRVVRDVAVFAAVAERDIAGLLDQGRPLLDRLSIRTSGAPPEVLGGRLADDLDTVVAVLIVAASAVAQFQRALQAVAVALLDPD